MDLASFCRPAGVALCVLALLVFGASLSHAQTVDDTGSEDGEDDALFPELRLPPPITIGDDEVQPPKRKLAAEAVDPYAAPGLRLGAFTLFPELKTSGVVTSNAQGTAGGTSDTALEVRPSLRLESDWVRHKLTMSGDATLERFAKNENLSSESGSVAAALRLDARRSTYVDLDVKYELQATGGESSEVPATAIGKRRDYTLSGFAALNHDLGGAELRLKLGAERRLYDDVELSGGGSEDNGDREFTAYTVALRGAFTRDAVLTPFIEAAYEPRIHDREADRNGIRRDSQGIRLTAGLAIDDDPVWSGEVGASLLYRTYEDGSLEDQWAPGLTASLGWQPTDLTRLEFNAGVSLEETVTAGQSATKRWFADVEATHALRENLDLKAGSGFTVEDGSGTVLTTEASLGLDWMVNPYLLLSAAYEASWVDVSSAPNYSEHRLVSSVTLRR
jgi:hypothetical protein